MNKRGDIWISAVIYIGLGIVAITLLLAAGIPIINNLRDKNTFIQTKDLMHSIDNTINTVVSEGPGSQRFLSPIEIKSGSLEIRGITKQIIWTSETKAQLQEPGTLIREGNLKLNLSQHRLKKDTYTAEIKLDYSEKQIILSINDDISKTLSDIKGKFGMTITNKGVYSDEIQDTVVDISIT